MSQRLTDQTRLLVLVGLCGLLWSLESIVPLYRYQNSRVRHAIPNVALTLILVLTNLALSFSSAYLAGLTVRNGLGLFPLISISLWTKAVMGVVALDLFAYFAHVALHKSWLGWQFHRVHHSLSALNAQMEHANIQMSSRLDRALRLVIVTPHMHKAHHSRDEKETDSNYSNIFSFWDRLCGTYTAEVDFRKLRYGLDGFDIKECQTLRGLLKMPFVSYTYLSARLIFRRRSGCLLPARLS